jgi:hypothetical protein
VTKEEKAEAAKLKARLLEITGEEEDDDDDADPKEKKFTDLIAKGVAKAFKKELKGRGKKPPSKDEKGFLDSFLEGLGIE